MSVCSATTPRVSLISDLKVIGVTGTNGKTTTSCLVASVLMQAGHRVGMAGKLGYFDGDDVCSPGRTTPPPGSWAPLLARMAVNGCSHAVLEVSRQALAESRVAGMQFDVVCVTNVRREYLEDCPRPEVRGPSHFRASDFPVNSVRLYPKIGTVPDYRPSRSQLFDHLAPEGVAVVNADDPAAAAALRRLDSPALTVGIRNPAEITATPLEQFPSEQTFLLSAGTESVPVRTRMIGIHHIYNCLTAAAVGLAYEIDLAAVVRGLEAVEYVPGRLERIECGQPFSVFVDGARSGAALAGCLKALRPVTAGRLICVFGADARSQGGKRLRMGRALAHFSDRAILTAGNPRDEDPTRIIAEILSGFRRPQDARVIVDRGEAIRSALAEARTGDCVLVAGKGCAEHQIIGRRRLPFNDRQVASEWLYAAGGEALRSET